MEYNYNEENDLYIIQLTEIIDSKLLQKTINRILSHTNPNTRDNIRPYYTYNLSFSSDYKYCVLDFNKREFEQEEIDEICHGRTR